jgi:hypothetical protein
VAIPGARGIAMPRATRELFSDVNRRLRPGSCRHAFTHENYSVNGTGRSISHGAHFFRHPIIIHLNPSDMSRGTGSERLKVGYLEVLTQKTVFTDRQIQLFRTFTSPSKHERYEVLLRSRKGRLKVCHDLDHFGDLDLRYCKRLLGAEQSQSRILAFLKALGAPRVCYIISSNSELDEMELNLSEALDGVVGRGCGSFVCCIPGELAYFEGESQGERYLCNRKVRRGAEKTFYDPSKRRDGR